MDEVQTAEYLAGALETGIPSYMLPALISVSRTNTSLERALTEYGRLGHAPIACCAAPMSVLDLHCTGVVRSKVEELQYVKLLVMSIIGLCGVDERHPRIPGNEALP